MTTSPWAGTTDTISQRPWWIAPPCTDATWLTPVRLISAPRTYASNRTSTLSRASRKWKYFQDSLLEVCPVSLRQPLLDCSARPRQNSPLYDPAFMFQYERAFMLPLHTPALSWPCTGGRQRRRNHPITIRAVEMSMQTLPSPGAQGPKP